MYHSHVLTVGVDQVTGDAISWFAPKLCFLGEEEKEQLCFWASCDTDVAKWV